MDIRARALIRSLTMLAVCAVSGVSTVVFFKFFPTEYIPHVFIGALIAMLVYVGYNISLNQLQEEETLKEISKKY